MSPLRRSNVLHRRRRLVIATAAILIAVLALTALEARRRAGLYWYDVRADQTWHFDSGHDLDVDLGPDGFVVPGTVSAGQTLVLTVDLASTVAGRWFEPELRVTLAGGETSVHYFERGARGQRHLVLGPVTAADVGAPALMTAAHLRWNRGPTPLQTFDPPSGLSGPVLVLATHPDDAEIAAFGLYSNTDSWVVTVSAGQSADPRLEHLIEDPRERSRLKGELRVFDSVTVPRWGGVPPDRAVNLGYFNLALAAMYSAPDRVVADPVTGDTDVRIFRDVAASGMLADRTPASSWSSLVEDLVVLLERVQPAVIVTPHPALDASSDHRLTTIALLEALDRVGPGGRTLLTYTNHAVGAEYYPFGPADGAVDLPPRTGEALVADGVFTHPLDPGQRIRKLYALEAQHDLRPAPRFVDASPSRRILAELGRTLGGLVRDPADSFSYLRRGPRTNEIFLVFREENAPRLRDDVRQWLLDVRSGGPDSPSY